MKLFCVRHGETDWNLEGRFQGRMDIPLNGRGVEQAKAVGKLLSHIRLDSIWSSHLSRARDTAEIIALHHGLSVITSPGISEISHGKWEGRKAEEIEELWPGMLEQWHKYPHTVTMPDGESLGHVLQRSVRAIDEICRDSSGNVAVVSHDAVLKALLCYWMGCPLASFWRFQLANCSITVVELEDRGIRIPLMGETSHLGYVFSRVEQKGL
ncbi:MAG: histidine phosphatase family protein [Synergistales bacterium]|nr:histidine phosphatase family protein [Synergistales bacterium]